MKIQVIDEQYFDSCTTARSMIYLHYGKGRRSYANDGRGIRPTLEVAWLADKTPTPWRENVLLCATDKDAGSVYLSDRELVRCATRGCLGKDQESLWRNNRIVLSVAHLLPNVSQALSSRLSRCYFMLILPQTATNSNTKQHEHGDSLESEDAP